MIWVAITTLIVLILGQLVTWYGIWAVARTMQDEVRRQDDRIRRRVERQGENEDSDRIGTLVDVIRAEAEKFPGEDLSDLLDRHPDARSVADFGEV